MAVNPVRTITKSTNKSIHETREFFSSSQQAVRRSNGVNLSIIIPSRNEVFLTHTIRDLLAHAVGSIEIIVNIDENWPDEIIKDKRVIYLHPGTPKGMRYGINSCAAIAKGIYLMKTDGHCMFAPGFDKVLSENCDDNWVVIPRRKRLDAENWKIMDVGKPDIDYHYLCFPERGKEHDWGMHGVMWPERALERIDPKYDIDDTMSFQGSSWFMKRKWFTDFIGYLDDDFYGSFAQEPQEIGLKTWLGGGAVKVNKKTWYAHLHKGPKYGKMYRLTMNDEKVIIAGHNRSAKHWMEGREPNMIHPIAWLVEKFWPVPTWPEDRSLWVSPI